MARPEERQQLRDPELVAEHRHAVAGVLVVGPSIVRLNRMLVLHGAAIVGVIVSAITAPRARPYVIRPYPPRASSRDAASRRDMRLPAPDTSSGVRQP